MKNEMKCYSLPDGRTALSRENLYYALDAQGLLNVNALSAAEQRSLTVVAEPDMLGLLLSSVDGKAWEAPETALAMDGVQRMELSYLRHCVILANGTIYIRNGKFTPLTDFLASAGREELTYMLWNVSLQAALAQAELSRRSQEERE